MNVRVLNQKDNILELEFSGTDVYFVNTLRRILVGEIPVLAIDEIDILENNTSFFDEYIAHRLAMIPIEDSPGVNTATLTLDAQGPGMVYSSELKGKVRPAYDNIPILKLREGQSIKLEAHVKRGLGKEHAKWTPCFAYYYEKDKKIILYIESFGNISVDKLYQRALDILNEKITAFESLADRL